MAGPGGEPGRRRPAAAAAGGAVTDWKPQYATYPWFTFLPPDAANGLIKDSGADAFQTKSVALAGFVRPLGAVTAARPDAVTAAIALCVGVP